jgi:hypothetical protein
MTIYGPGPERRQISIGLGLAELEASAAQGYVELPKKPCTGPLKEVFERGSAGPNLKVGIREADGGFYPASVFRGKIQEPGNELLRLLLTNPKSLRQVTLTVTPSKFEIGKKIDTEEEPIPDCDYGELGIGRAPGIITLFHVGDYVNYLLGRGSYVVRTRTFQMIGTDRFREVPIYSRPVYEAPQTVLSGGQGGLEVKPDWSLSQVRAFSQAALLEIINELDPAHPSLNKTGHLPSVQLDPKLKPAKEIAALVVEQLQT